MAREAPVMSGCDGPTPPQKICMPPPVPVDSTTGARHAGHAGELLGDRLGVGKHGRRTDDADLVARLREGGRTGGRHRNGCGASVKS
jgi:hypothetical protein